jgi:SAM-dependent methyltransferase
MASIRKPFQGVWNIIQFNWPFYVVSSILFLFLLYLLPELPPPFQTYGYLLACIGIAVFLFSLVVSWYVYDCSNLYQLDWIDELNFLPTDRLVNIHAGFDETSVLLNAKFPVSLLAVFDFYDPLKHTEASIKRARKVYPPFPGTLSTGTTSLPLEDQSIDLVVVMLAAHEIRNHEERVCFFRSLERILKPSGNIAVVEHLRDLPNFSAYTIGFFHFHSKATWRKTFRDAGLKLKQEKKITPFISIFILQKNGTAL